MCFVSTAKLAADSPEDFDANAWEVIPDLAIEVTSPSDRAEVNGRRSRSIFQLRRPLRLGRVPEARTRRRLRVLGLLSHIRVPGHLARRSDPARLELQLDELFRPFGPAEG